MLGYLSPAEFEKGTLGEDGASLVASRLASTVQGNQVETLEGPSVSGGTGPLQEREMGRFQARPEFCRITKIDAPREFRRL